MVALGARETMEKREVELARAEREKTMTCDCTVPRPVFIILSF